MTAFNSSVITQPFNISVVTSNGTDQLKILVAPSWVGAPNVRGTMDILRSCILTLVACIYTALHLDVPRKTTWQYLLWEKSKWVLVTLFAPEVAAYMAASQLRYAWDLRSALRKIQKRKQESNWTRDADFEIDLKYCFFIIMGALRFDVNDMLSLPDLDNADSKYFDHFGRTRHSVRPGPAAIIRLAERGHWIQIRKEQIDDKSKANTIQKVLVLLQVTWMVTQCIARRIYTFPLSLLEIHTIVHVVCAVFLYACWFEKPLNVQEAIVYETKGFRGELAAMLQRHFYSRKTTEMALFTPKHQQDDPSHLIDGDGSPMRWIESQPQLVMEVGDILPSGLALSRVNSWKSGDPPVYKLGRHLYRPVSFVLTHEFLARWEAILATFPFEGREKLAKEAEIVGDLKDAERCEPHDTKPRQNILYLCMLEEFEPPCLSDWNRLFWEGRSILHINDPEEKEAWKDFITQSNLTSYSWALATLAAILSGLYGGVHLTIWGQTFPSYVEEVMWKVSCLLVVFCIPVLLTLFYFISYLDNINIPSEGIAQRVVETAIIVPFFGSVLLLLLVILCHAVARAFIIVESFLSLRRTPVGVFITPEWVELFPHF